MAAQWRKASAGGKHLAIGSHREQRLALIARRQAHLLTTAQLRSLGLGPHGVHGRMRRGLLHRLHWGVYATHPPPYSREQSCLAATLACGPGALLSGLPCAEHWRITERSPGRIDLIVPGGRGRTRAGITVHRQLVDPRDVRRKDGIPCTSVDRVLVDVAPVLSEAELETMLVAAESLGLLRRPRLAELITERRGRPGIAKLERITRLEPALTRSDLELAFLPIWRRAGVPRPLVNHAVAVPSRKSPLLVDFAWPGIRMVVEADSQRFHGDWQRAEADRERDQLLALAGWLSHRFARGRITGDAEGCAVRLRHLHEARAAEVRGPVAA